MLSSSPRPIGIVGLNFGRHILPHLQDPDVSRLFRLAAVCDLDASRRREWAARYQVSEYESLDALLEEPGIPVIGLFTPPKGRAALLRRIIRAGRDVMTTKPFELDSVAAREVLEEAASLGRIIHLNSPAPRPSAVRRQIQEWEARHHLGRPVFCRGEATADYHEDADGTWYDDPALCPVAPIFRIGIYLINELTGLFGDVISTQVIATHIRTGRPTPDNAQLSLEFANGAIGSIFASFCVGNGQFHANSLLLHYERGTIQYNLDPAPFAQANKSSRLRLIATPPNREEVMIEEWSGPGCIGDYQWLAFYDAISTRDIHSMPMKEILRGIEVINAMIRSASTGTRPS